jgi:hypothetical protein
MMNGWIKKFADNTQEIGEDNFVRIKLASWTQGRLSNIIGVELCHNDQRIFFDGIGSFWQSDDYEIDFLESTPKIKTRRLQKKITNYDRFITYEHIDNTYWFKLLPVPNGHINVIQIPNHAQEKWFTVELNIETQKVSWRYEENKI